MTESRGEVWHSGEWDNSATIAAIEAWTVRSQTQWCAMHAERHGAKASAVEPIADGAAFFAGHGSPLTKVSGITVWNESTAEAIVDFARRHETAIEIDVPDVAWDVATPVLSSAGAWTSFRESVLVRRAPDNSPPDPAALQLYPGTTIEECTTAETTTESARFLGRAALAPAPPSDLIYDVGRTSLALPDTRAWLIRSDEGVVATGCLSAPSSLDFGTKDAPQEWASLFGAATALAWRRRGLQGALLEQRLGVLPAGTPTLIVTGVETASERNAIKFGFERLYVRAVWELALGSGG